MKKARRANALDVQLKAILTRAGQQTISEIVKVADESGLEFTAQDYEDTISELLEEKMRQVRSTRRSWRSFLAGWL